MTTIQSIKAISILNENNFLPNGIEMNTRLKLIDIASNNFKYRGYEYADYGRNYDNSVVAFRFEHAMVEKPFWIVLFNGAQAKVSSEMIASAFWKLPDLDDAVYAEQGITFNDASDGVETIMSIVEKFNYLWFAKDDASEEEPLIWGDFDLLNWLADEFENILNIRIKLSVPPEQIKEHHIKDLEKALADAKVALLNNHKSESISANNTINNTNTKITKENINKYYEFMSDEDIREYSILLNNIFNERINFITHSLRIKRVDLKNIDISTSKLLNDSLYIELSYFGLKDTLKSLDEYVKEIKESEAFKEHLMQKLAVSGEVILDTFKYTVKVVSSSNGFDVDVYPKGTIADEDGEFDEDLMLDGGIVQDGNECDAINYAYEF